MTCVCVCVGMDGNGNGASGLDWILDLVGHLGLTSTSTSAVMSHVPRCTRGVLWLCTSGCIGSQVNSWRCAEWGEGQERAGGGAAHVLSRSRAGHAI